MKIPFIIYAQAYGIYLLLTIPAFTEPIVYLYSVMYAFVAGFIAIIVFALLFWLLHLTKPRYKAAISIMFSGVILAVAIGFKMLLLLAIPGRGFWEIDGDTLFPVAAVIAGCIAVYINIPNIKNHFSPTLEEEIHTIGVQP